VAGGAVAGDPTGVGEVLAGVAEGLVVCDGLGDRVGWGEVRAGVGAVEEEVVPGCVAPAGAAVGPGLTRM
jgi:hypothetical protein